MTEEDGGPFGIGVILASNKPGNYPDKQSFSSDLHIVNEGDRDALCLTWRLVLFAFNLIPLRLHHSLILLRSWFRDSATVTLTPGDGTDR